MDAETAAHRWATTWERAWNAGDVDAIVSLYAPDAILSTAPFREPYRGRDGVRAYVSQAFGEEEEVSARFGVPIVDDGRAAVQWWATLRERGVVTTLAGTSVLRFDADGRVVDQWDAWHAVDAHWDAPAEWGSLDATR